MAYWDGRIGGCWWAYFHGSIEDGEWERFCAHQRAAYTRATPGDVILTIPFAAGAPSAKDRKAIGDLIAETHARNPITHHAFATDSRVIFMINTAIGWLGNKPYTESTFSDPVEAVRWLSTVGRGVDERAVLDAIATAVPSTALWSPIARATAGGGARRTG